MFTVGAIIDRPRAFDERPYKQISAEYLFSLPICVIMGLAKSLLPRGRRNGVAVTEGACVTLNFLVTHSPSVSFADSSLPEGALGRATVGLWALSEAL